MIETTELAGTELAGVWYCGQAWTWWVGVLHVNTHTKCACPQLRMHCIEFCRTTSQIALHLVPRELHQIAASNCLQYHALTNLGLLPATPVVGLKSRHIGGNTTGLTVLKVDKALCT